MLTLPADAPPDPFVVPPADFVVKRTEGGGLGLLRDDEVVEVRSFNRYWMTLETGEIVQLA